MISVALYEPEIPPNTGNIGRLCAAVKVTLHIVGPPAFRMDNRTVRRAGLDYWQHVDLRQHSGLETFKTELTTLTNPPARLICLTTKASRSYTDWQYQENDCLLFGPETRGLPEHILQTHHDTCLTIPMTSPHVRSLNLANSVSIVLYEALRQLGFPPRTHEIQE